MKIIQSFHFCNGKFHFRNGNFYKCSSLEQIVIPKSVISIQIVAFGEYNSLKRIYVPTHLDLNEIEINNGCSVYRNSDIK